MVQTRTRSGRQIKKPELYKPEETVVLEDDYLPDEHDSDFDSDIYGVNVGEFSKLKIERISFALGLDYFYTPRLSFYTKYNYRDYNDKEVNSLDGQLNYFSIRMNYTF